MTTEPGEEIGHGDSREDLSTPDCDEQVVPEWHEPVSDCESEGDGNAEPGPS